MSTGFFHQPLPALDVSKFMAGVHWLLAGVRQCMPPVLRNKWWRPSYRLLEYNEGKHHAVGTVEQSWLGEKRLSNKKTDANFDLPAVISLSNDQIFQTSIELPSQARPNLRQAVSLRLDDISPIPTADATFALGEITTLPNSRILVEIAIAHTNSVKNAQHAQGATIAVGACLQQNGELKYPFKQQGLSNPAARYLFLTFASFWVALLLVGFSLSNRFERAITIQNAHEASLIDEIKNTRQGTAKANSLPASISTLTTMRQLQRHIEKTIGSAPPDTVIEAIEFNNNHLLLSGLAPIHSLTDSNFSGIQITPSQYEGYQQFSRALQIPTPDENTPPK